MHSLSPPLHSTLMLILIQNPHQLNTPNSQATASNKLLTCTREKLATTNMGLQPKSSTTPAASPLMIISMKGHPGTGKSTLAHNLSNILHYPLIDKDDIKNSTFTLESNLPASAHSLLNDMSYTAMWNVAATQLKLGLSVIVDAPLSRPEYFNKLTRIAKESGARVVVVECRPRDWEEWKRRLERRGEEEGAVWHKPAKWEEIERLLEGYNGCYEYEVGSKVAKVVVDTTASFCVDDIVNFILENKEGGYLELPIL